MLRRAILLMYRFALGCTRAVFFQNPDDRAFFIRQGIVAPSQAILVPGSGIDLSHYSVADLPTDLRFLMVSRLLRDKGVLEYVEAARKMKEKLPSANFSLLGQIDEGNRTAVQERDLHQWAQKGVIEYLGATDDVRPYIRDATAIVLPSYREGLPRTLLEAAAMGRPLIGTDVPGCRELIREGITGFLCRARDVDSLVAAMERLAAIPHEARVRMGSQGRKMAEREFDEKLVVQEYLRVLGQLSL